MIDTVEIPGIQQYAGMSSSRTPDIPPNGNPEGKFKVEPFAKAYKESANRERTNKKAQRDREIAIKRMEETGELLGRDHEIYKTIDKICYRLKPEVTPDVKISLSDSPKAFTLRDKKTIVLSSGLLKELEEYVKTKGKKLNEDHIALIIGHEISHWDDEAKKIHINERYCDTNGLMLCNTAGYNIDDAVDALEYLEFADERAKVESGLDNQEGTVVDLGEVTHPNPEDRRILIQSIANDPNAYLEGRYTTPTPLATTVYVDLKQKAEQWLEQAKRRETIASDEDVAREFRQSKTLSQTLETFLSADNYYHANMSREFTQTQDFGNMLLAMAVFGEITGTDFTLLNKNDFRAQFKADLITQHVSSSSPTQELQVPVIPTSFSTSKNLSSEQIQLVQDCLDGKFQNPLTILTATKEELTKNLPQFSGFTFNHFFKGIAVDVNHFIQPELYLGGSISKSAQNLDRARLLGLQSKVAIDSYLGDESTGITTKISEDRTVLLNTIRYALSSSILRLSQHKATSWAHREWLNFDTPASEKVRDLAKYLPDYTRIQNQMKDCLLNAGICSTESVANFVSLMILECGQYLEDFSVGLGVQNNKQTLVSQWPNLGNYWTSNEQVFQDYRNVIFNSHISLSQGGQILGQALGRPNVNRFIDLMNRYMVRLVDDQNHLLGSQLDPYDIIIRGDPTIEIPYTDNYLDWDFNQPTIDFVGRMFSSSSNWYGEKFSAESLYCTTSDSTIIKRLILESVTNTGSGIRRERRNRIIEAVLKNDQARTNISLFRSILKEGIDNNSLIPSEIYQILEGVDNFPLYQDFKEYLEENSLGGFYKRSFEELRQNLEQQGVALPEIIARFIEAGGVVESTGAHYSSNYGARVIPDSEFGENWFHNSGHPYPEHPNFSFHDASQLASRIIRYTERTDFPHSETVRQILLNNAAGLIRYSEKLSQSFGLAGSSASIPEFQGEGITSLEQLVQRISKMPATTYRDMYIDRVMLTLLDDTSEFRKNNQISLDQVKTMFSLYSPQRLTAFDPETDEGGLSLPKPLDVLPLQKESFDIREMYPFKSNSNDPLLEWLQEYADMLDNEFQAADGNRLAAKLDQVIQAIPHPSSIRDYLIERTLFPFQRGDNPFSNISPNERLSILQTAYEASHTVRTKGALGRQIAEIKLNDLGSSLTFENGISVILETMPSRSVTRDHLLLTVLNNTYTTWEQINRAQVLLLGDDYQTEESGSATRSAVNEAIFRKIKDMTTDERDELMLFLLDKTKHVLKPEDLAEDFFDDKVLAKLKKKLVGTYGQIVPYRRSPLYAKTTDPRHHSQITNPVEFQAATFDQFRSEIKQYFLKRFRGEDTSELGRFFYDNIRPNPHELFTILNQIEFPEILQLALPDSLNTFFQEQLGDRDRTVSATSLGPLFVTLSPEDRRQLIYRLCLGSNGFFEQKKIDQYGKRILEKFIDLSTQEILPEIGSEQTTRRWSAQEIDTAKIVLVTTFNALDPGRRTEVFSRIINLIIDSGGNINKEQIIKTTLTAFGVVGAKVGQMDQLLPEYLRDGLGSLKEQVPPIPKTTVAQVMRKSGRDHYYSGLGSTIGAASTATVYLAKRRGQTEEDRVVKVLRPDALKHVDSDLDAVRAVVTTLKDTGAISVNPSQIIEELKLMIAEEFNPKNEQRNIQDIKQGRKNPKIKKRVLEILRIKEQEISSKVKVPMVDFAGDAHLEMSRALGFSLAKIEEMRAKASRGDSLTEEENRYLHIDLKSVHEAIVSDFFEQAFTTGVFHTDLHQGNIFIDVNGNITEIDHGQVGREQSTSKRRAFVEFVVGLARNEPRLVAQAISTFDTNVNQKTLQNFISTQATSNNDLLGTTTRFVSDNNIQGSINRFTKAMVNIFPYIRSLDEATLKKIMLPYITDAAVIFDLERAVPGMITEPIKEAIKAKLAPVIDEAARLNRVRQDPAMADALEAVLRTTIGSATIGADIIYLLGKSEDTIMGMPVPSSLKPVWEVVQLLSGKNRNTRERETLQHLLTTRFETRREDTERLKDALRKLRERYREEKIVYQTNQEELDQAMRDFGVTTK